MHVIDSLSDEKIASLQEFAAFVARQTKVHNLISASTRDDIWNRHVIDSLYGYDSIMHATRTVDVGSGGGFPGIPLAIALPSVEFTLIESVRKKAVYLRRACDHLSLQNVKILAGRVEEIAHDTDYRQRFDHATARAVAPLRVLCEYVLPFLEIGGEMIAYKGSRAEIELMEAENALHILGGSVVPLQRMEESETVLVVIKKTDSTPPDYPRISGTPSKRPL